MSGHSKWAQIKHKKAGADAKRGALFSKLGRIVTVAAREGGPDPDMNPKLRQAIDQARDGGMPKDNIERAIARASGPGEGESLTAVEYEAYGPGGSALLISGLTDSTNRTTNQIKNILDDLGGRLTTAGSVSWMFDRRMIAEFSLENASRDALELALIDAGAEDTSMHDHALEALVAPERFEQFRKAAASSGFLPLRTTLAAIPKNTVTLQAADKEKALALAGALEDHPDINDVWTNIAE